MSREEESLPRLLTRATASLAVALVLVLTVLGASPELHERLHGHGPAAPGTAHHDEAPSGDGQAAGDEDGCVVTLFAQGLVLALALLVLATAVRMLRLVGTDLRDRIIPAAPRYLRLPSQAPPAVLC